MIYPDIKISDLEKDLELKKLHLENSRNSFLDTAKTELHPITFFKNHKTAVLGTLIGMVTFGKFFGKFSRTVAPKLKKSVVWTPAGAGVMWKLLNLSLGIQRLLSSHKSNPSK
jgi:hypothetical protein